MKKQTGFLDKLAFIISEIGVPPLFSAIVFGILSFSFTPDLDQALLIAFLSIFFSSILPTAFILWLLASGQVDHRHVPDKAKRTLPYLIGFLCFAIGFAILHWLHAAHIIQALMFASAVNTLVTTFINLRWKISGHTIGAGAGIAGLQAAFGWHVAWLYILVFVIGWSRVRLRVHTLSQVIGGAILGIGLTLVQMAWYL